ncbi:MAG: hypothetical protein LBI92_09070 [Azoarcus sp.]|nr:hypothetical protein [Azoarcus sp.]
MYNNGIRAIALGQLHAPPLPLRIYTEQMFSIEIGSCGDESAHLDAAFVWDGIETNEIDPSCAWARRASRRLLAVSMSRFKKTESYIKQKTESVARCKPLCVNKKMSAMYDISIHAI